MFKFKLWGFSTMRMAFITIALSVAELGMLLRHSPYAGSATFNTAWNHAQAALGKDPDGYRAEFLTLIETARRLTGQGE